VSPVINKLAKQCLPDNAVNLLIYFRHMIRQRRQAVIDLLQSNQFDADLMPSPTLRFRAQSQIAHWTQFLNTGLNCAQNIRSALGRIGKRIDQFDKILDFGCGCGRILRWFENIENLGVVRGADIDRGAISWCSNKLPFAEFDLVTEDPPLPYEDNAFDLVLCMSVLSHMDLDRQVAWAAELKRVTRPSGIALSTFMSRTEGCMLKGHEIDELSENGFFFQAQKSGIFKLDGLPDNYQKAFQTQKSAISLYSKSFAVKDCLIGGFSNTEDLLILENQT